MRAYSTEERNASELRAVPRRRFMILTMVLSLNAFVLGGCSTLLIVNHLLNSLLDVYTANQSMAAASAILDFMDDLLYFYLIYGAVFLVLVLSTACVLTWMVTQSRILRYGIILLCLLILVVLGGMWLTGGTGVPVVPPTTPTPSTGSFRETSSVPGAIRASALPVTCLRLWCANDTTATFCSIVAKLMRLALETLLVGNSDKGRFRSI